MHWDVWVEHHTSHGTHRALIKHVCDYGCTGSWLRDCAQIGRVMATGSQSMSGEKLTGSGNPYVESQGSSPGKVAESSDQPVSDPPWKRRRKRAPIVDAATAPTPIDVEEEVACVRRELPPVDVSLKVVDHVQETLASDTELVDVVDMPEPTLEDELLRAVGLDT